MGLVDWFEWKLLHTDKFISFITTYVYINEWSLLFNIFMTKYLLLKQLIKCIL